MPNAKPKNSPAMVPTLPGTRSVAYTKIAEKADEMITPITIASTAVINNPTCGKSSVKGAAPKIETQITSFRPYRSPRSEEHTSELQSRENLVCRLLLEK